MSNSWVSRSLIPFLFLVALLLVSSSFSLYTYNSIVKIYGGEAHPVPELVSHGLALLPSSMLPPEHRIVVTSPAPLASSEPTMVSAPEQMPERCLNPRIEKGFLQRVTSAYRNHANAKKFLVYRHGVGPSMGTEAAFVSDGRRITVFYTSTESTEGMSFWERPDGTIATIELDAFYDTNLDGCVDYGNGGIHVDENGRAMQLENGIVTGPEYHKYWQERYADAVARLATTLGM